MTPPYIRTAKRLGNNKRRFLYVNALQAKHIPAKPNETFRLFDKLARKAAEKWKGERLFIIGFAETATAIGARLAEIAAADGYFAATTREFDKHNDYIEFSESHSHAALQLLDTYNLDKAINCGRIVFAEDEVTTAKTIEKLIRKLNARYPDKNLKYGVASILNSVEECRVEVLNSLNAEFVYLNKIPLNPIADEINSYKYLDSSHFKIQSAEPVSYEVHYIDAPYINQRKTSKTREYTSAARAFAELAAGKAELNGAQRVLILGTEEFMYPAILTAFILSRKYPDKEFYTHSTTRSPIEVSADENYPLFSRYEIESLYERGRANYIYNLESCDKVIVLTDAPYNENSYLNFARALSPAGVKRAYFFVWKNE